MILKKRLFKIIFCLINTHSHIGFVIIHNYWDWAYKHGSKYVIQVFFFLISVLLRNNWQVFFFQASLLIVML